MQIRFEPRRMPDSVHIAKTFAAYVMGADAHNNNRTLHLGPFRKDGADDDHWQLDCSNSFWLHIDRVTGTIEVNCRYDSDLPVAEAMLELYKARYNLK